LRHIPLITIGIALFIAGCTTRPAIKPIVSREGLNGIDFVGAIGEWTGARPDEISLISSRGNSMEPFIHQDDLLLVEPADGVQLQAGMVAIYQPLVRRRGITPKLICHMIDEVDGDRVHFSGTGPLAANEWVYRYQVKYVVRRIVHPLSG
jgi:hypothetical protein